MLPTEASIAQGIASSVTSTTTYIILSLLTAFIIYFFKLLDFFEIPNSYKMILAVVLPFALWEFILSAIFGSLGIPLDWGNYNYKFPDFLGSSDITLTSGVMFSRFLDFIFNFGLFREFGIPYLTEFIKNIPLDTMVTITVPEDAGVFVLLKVVFSSWFTLLTWIYVSADSLIDLVFFFVLFSAGLAVFAENTKNQKLYAFGFALIPVILYSYYISNPFEEYPNALIMLQKVFYFWENADNWSLIMFFGTLIIAFGIVMETVALVMYLILKGGTMTLQPSWATKEWSISQHGIAFGYTAAFAVMYAMHGYAFYIFFPFLILYTIFKRISGTAIDTMNAHAEKQEIHDLISSINNNDGHPTPIKSTSENKNVVEYILYIGIIGIILLLLYNNGFI